MLAVIREQNLFWFMYLLCCPNKNCTVVDLSLCHSRYFQFKVLHSSTLIKMSNILCLRLWGQIICKHSSLISTFCTKEVEVNLRAYWQVLCWKVQWCRDWFLTKTVILKVILTNTRNMLKTDEAAITPFVYSTEKCSQLHTDSCVILVVPIKYSAVLGQKLTTFPSYINHAYITSKTMFISFFLLFTAS